MFGLPAVKHWARLKWLAWLQPRVKASAERIFNRNTIYIVPTKAGLALVFTTALILFAAINYENNSLFLLGFIVLAIFVISILSTFENMQGLMLQRMSAKLVQQGEDALFGLRLKPRAGRFSHALELSLGEQTVAIETLAQAGEFHLSQKTTQRGVLKAGLVKLESRYPFGLVSAWGYGNLELAAYVYPVPKKSAMNASHSSDATRELQRQDADDYQNIRPWHQGESPKRILWPAYARSNELLAFDYEQQAHNPRQLDWYALEGESETKLANLCYWVLQCAREQTPFSLRLPAASLAMNSGQNAVDEALKALALFGAQS